MARRCDNCLLLLPLRAGAIAWATVIFVYSVIGGIILFKYGPFWFFTYPEWQIYGGVSLGIGAVALMNMIALSSRSVVFTRACKFFWPFVIVISAVRAIIMIVELNRYQTEITWECNNGGQIWVSAAANTSTTSIPSTFCTSGFSTLFEAFIISLLVDLVFQLYMFFLTWRYSKRQEHYDSMKGPFHGGFYNA
ncbi:hypothetical protein JAAARDRAFT_363930 [Jaapia argillacea MUCL 33604]|uniref:MARVEL domain-containing protein n=1 Tax=Jaapia argillacea MUCL 33604 TaxID=933084 RepID=A0A067Q7U3_9AGAM|nr:hypothetical protein JAAARDRAFT_363930 [Jaapia argillacea MUCL 33604]